MKNYAKVMIETKGLSSLSQFKRALSLEKKRRTEYFGSGSGLEGSGIGRNMRRNERKTGQIGIGDKFGK